MTRTRRVGALIAVALAVALTLSACVSPLPTPTPTPTPVAAPTPTPSTAADPITTVAALVMRPESLQLMDVDGTVVAHLDYLSDPADAVGVLTALFGAAPTDEDFSGSSHFPPTTAHRWGDFTLWEQRYVDTWSDVEDVGTSLYRPPFAVQFTGPDALGIELTEVTGRHVGEPWADLMSDPGVLTNPSGCSGPYIDYVALDEVLPDGTPYVQKVSVHFMLSDDGVAIGRIGAPVPVYDGCA